MKSTFIKLPIISAVLLTIAWLLGKLIPFYTVFKLLHVLAFVLLGAGLLGVLVSDLRARRAQSLPLLVDSLEAMMTFYYKLVMPGSLGILLSGFTMIFGYYGWTFLDMPWLSGMMVLFVFEFFEGHLIMKMHYLKLREGVAQAKATGGCVPALESELRARLTTATHFLDVPNFALIVVLGILRPTDWTVFAVGLPLVIVVTAWMTNRIPKRLPWQGAFTKSPSAA
ncbi:MAG: DUF2269 family protein [Polaromonas sp.]|uniref:DUF2269 family protein n=1 Tax=Polaromonas sp. TaxID=1869339 RepID=UPI0025FEED33|nr:DUF2269 family protein [Polaromonas sp.]MBI2724767.1 DUF2269 family protein [Polaromonas sp.]